MMEDPAGFRVELGIFGRTPVLGRCKQRLAKEVGIEQAFVTYRALFRHTLLCASFASRMSPDLIPVLWHFGDDPSAYLDGCVRFEVYPQPGADFAANMQAVIDRIHQPENRAALIIGSDHPGLRPRHLLEAAEVLNACDVLLAPTEDGGFWALGTRVPLPDIFSGMIFSTPAVFDELLDRIKARGLSVHIGDRLFDIDTAADLQRLKKNSLFR